MAECFSVNLFNKVTQHLNYEHYQYYSNEKQGVIHFGISMKGNINNLQYHIIVMDNCFVTYAVFPISGDIEDKKQMTELAGYLQIVNCNLLEGNLELDPLNGEIRIKYFVNCAGIIPSAEIIEDSVQCPAAIYNCYGRGILGIIFNHMKAEEAIAFCERSNDPFEPEMNEYYRSEDIFHNEDFIPPDVQDFLNDLFDQYNDHDDSDPSKKNE